MVPTIIHLLRNSRSTYRIDDRDLSLLSLGDGMVRDGILLDNDDVDFSAPVVVDTSDPEVSQVIDAINLYKPDLRFVFNVTQVSGNSRLMSLTFLPRGNVVFRVDVPLSLPFLPGGPLAVDGPLDGIAFCEVLRRARTSITFDTSLSCGDISNPGGDDVFVRRIAKTLCRRSSSWEYGGVFRLRGYLRDLCEPVSLLYALNTNDDEQPYYFRLHDGRVTYKTGLREVVFVARDGFLEVVAERPKRTS